MNDRQSVYYLVRRLRVHAPNQDFDLALEVLQAVRLFFLQAKSFPYLLDVLSPCDVVLEGRKKLEEGLRGALCLPAQLLTYQGVGHEVN